MLTFFIVNIFRVSNPRLANGHFAPYFFELYSAAFAISPDTHVPNRNRIPTDIVRLNGVRFLSCREPNAAQQLSAALLKKLVGGDTVVARHLSKEEEEFKPHFKLNILANRLPRIDSPDDALWQRVRVIPFDVHVPSVMPIVGNLAQQLVADEGIGILAWLVRGAVAYFAGGLEEPAEVPDDYSEDWRLFDTAPD